MTGDGCVSPRIASVAAWRPPTSCEGSASGALLYAGRWPARYTPGGGPCAIAGRWSVRYSWAVVRAL
jgi:hypothetical protein